MPIRRKHRHAMRASKRRLARAAVIVAAAAASAAVVTASVLASPDDPVTRNAGQARSFSPLTEPSEPGASATVTTPSPTATPTATGSPEPTASESEPEPGESPDQPPTNTEHVDFSPFPDASTTGVPDDVALETVGDLKIKEDGAVIDGKLIDGYVIVQANNVTIKRSFIKAGATYPIKLESGYRDLLVEDVEIDGQGRKGPAIVGNHYTLRRVNIHNISEGPRVGTGDVVEDSYIHHLVQCEGCHHDILQSTGGTDIVIRGNNLQAYNPELDIFFNAAYQFGTEFSPMNNVLVEGNLMNGGNYTVNGGGGNTDDAAVVFRHNRFMRDSNYGAAANLGPDVDFDDTNVWHDTGEPVFD